MKFIKIPCFNKYQLGTLPTRFWMALSFVGNKLQQKSEDSE